MWGVRLASGGQSKHQNITFKAGQKLESTHALTFLHFFIKVFLVVSLSLPQTRTGVLSLESQRKVTTLWLHYRLERTDEIKSACERRNRPCDNMPVPLSETKHGTNS